jgi:galactose mutarotase-like enzyme
MELNSVVLFLLGNNMVVTLVNDFLELTVNTKGGEMNSLRDVKTGTDYVWPGDPDVWKFHAPVLFPHCGKTKDGFVLINGKEYALKSNGFARDMEHKIVKQTKDSVTFELTQSEETADKYPWKFRLNITYVLREDGVTFTSTVTNTDSETISFSLGSHTAFACPRKSDPAGTENSDYQIEFEKREPLVNVICCDNGLLANDEDGDSPTTRRYNEREAGIIPLSEKGFGNGHLFTAFTSDWVGLRNNKDDSLVKVNTKGYPYVMIWQNAGVPAFVCIEPWYGMPDPDQSDHDWDKKPGLISLEPGKSFTADQSITICKK